MQRALWFLLVVGCSTSDKQPDKEGDVHVVSQKRATVAAGSGSSRFQTDRAGACQEFTTRLQTPITADLVNDVAKKCAEGKDVTTANYDCLVAATTLPAIETCLKQPSPPAGKVDAAKCDAYAKHVVDLMTAELSGTSMRMCMSGRMTEQAYDCVMTASSDADFKKCLGANPM